MDPAGEYVDAISRKYHRSISTDSYGPTPVQSAYEGKTLFVTGAFGFLGKHLIYTLFRTCKIKKAFLLLRPKREKSVPERLKTLINDSMYDSIKAEQPDFASKLVPIEGDVKELNLGIDSDDWRVLTDQVEIIIHGAATINFQEPIKMATLINVRGTREIIRLARDCSKLRALVHISTAYCQATRTRIGSEVSEEFYPNPIGPDALVHLAETLDGQVMDAVVRPLRSNWPNTYTFTKAVAEEMLRDAQDLPISIVRPAIVINAYREPEPGWLDPGQINGPSGLVVGAALGVLHASYMADKASVDMVPVDYVSNAVVAAGYTAMEGRGRIYNMVTTRHRALLEEKFAYLYESLTVKFCTPKAVWYGFLYSTDRRWLYLTLFWLMHVIPAYVLDAFLFCIGKPSTLIYTGGFTIKKSKTILIQIAGAVFGFVKIAKKVSKLSDVLSYFMVNTWEFDDKNTASLYHSLTENDRELFYFDISTVNWEEQIFLWSIGCRKYCIQDELKDTVYAIKKQFWLRIVHYVFTILIFYTIWLIFKWFAQHGLTREFVALQYKAEGKQLEI